MHCHTIMDNDNEVAATSWSCTTLDASKQYSKLI